MDPPGPAKPPEKRKLDGSPRPLTTTLTSQNVLRFGRRDDNASDNRLSQGSVKRLPLSDACHAHGSAASRPRLGEAHVLGSRGAITSPRKQLAAMTSEPISRAFGGMRRCGDGELCVAAPDGVVIPVGTYADRHGHYICAVSLPSKATHRYNCGRW
jgi:hypothetical protein